VAETAIPLDAPTELVGTWHVPGAEERPAAGRLLFDPAEGLHLETISDLPLLLTFEVPILLGVTVDGRLVTLRNVHRLKQNYNSSGGVLTQASAQMAFVGMHATTEDELRLHAVQARLSHLNEWCFVSGVDLSNAIFPTGGTISFQQLDPLILARVRSALIGVWFDFDGRRVPDRADRPYELELRQQAWLTIRPRRRWRYDDFDELLTRIRWFFGFAAGAQDQLLELRGEATITTRTFGPHGRRSRPRRPVWIVFAPPRLAAPEPRAAAEMLFYRADLDDGELQRPLTRWLSLCRRLEMDPVFGPYFAALATSSMYSDLRFLIFAQVAEAYHARRAPSKVYFAKRIQLLVERMPRALRRSMPATFAREVTDTRNFETHRDSRSRLRAATGARLFAIAELLKLTFEISILRELGFSQAAITTLIARNRRVDGMRRRALEILEETTPGRP
jgi:ApeA-like protein/HEPN superfamily Apea-like protein